jgi:hypothetical protein
LNLVSSIFSQILQLFSRLECEGAVLKHNAERHALGFTCWEQFVAMLFRQLGHAQSPREICGGLAASEGKLKPIVMACRLVNRNLALDERLPLIEGRPSDHSCPVTRTWLDLLFAQTPHAPR